jgi:transcriptional regulator with XRE-family HTH domain
MEEKKYPLQLEEYELYGKYFDMPERKELIGETFKQLRTAANLSQIELSDILGIKPGTYSTYENGTREAPAEIIVRMSILFGVPTDCILQKTRYRYENFLDTEQFEKFDKDIEDIINLTYDEELNPEFKNILETMTDAFGTISEQLKELNEKAVPKGQE